MCSGVPRPGLAARPRSQAAPILIPCAGPGARLNDDYIASEWSPIDMLQRAWERALPHLVILCVASFAIFVVQTGVGFVFGFIEGIVGAVAEGIAQERGGDAAVYGAIAVKLVMALGRVCVTFPLTMLTTGAIARMGLSAARGEAPDLGAFSVSLSKLLSVIGASLVVAFATGFGFLFLIIPGLLLAFALQFYLLALLDTELGVFGAIQYSWKLTQGHLLNLFVFAILMGVIGLVAFCGTCGLGMIVWQPIAVVAQSLIYIHLSGRTRDFQPDPVL